MSLKQEIVRLEGHSSTVSEIIFDMKDEEKASQLNHHS